MAEGADDLMAHIVGLTIDQREDGVWFVFSWEGDDWHAALDAVKERIPPEAREFDKEGKVWRVAEAFEDELAEIFSNFAGSLDAIRSQVSMF